LPVVTPLLAAFALIAFASNSLLCRLALGGREIDPVSFTSVRLLSGAAALAAIHRVSRTARGATPSVRERSRAGSWTSALWLFLYALPFSLAYVSLGVAAGALILFLSVQATMLLGAVRLGERIRLLEACGIAVAFGGLAYLLSPGLTAPHPTGSALMVVAGIAWGLYSLRGRGSSDPIGDTAMNFLRSAPFTVLASAVAMGSARLSARGVVLAAASGVIASGIGYAAWFAALRKLTAFRAAALQLTVPVIAAVGGILLLSERVTPRLLLSSALILGGVGFALARRRVDKR
jgi:drug/metabolite transporter (DMT)-like permease